MTRIQKHPIQMINTIVFKTHTHIPSLVENARAMSLFINALMKHLWEVKSTWVLTTEYPHLTTVTCPFIQNLWAPDAMDTGIEQGIYSTSGSEPYKERFYYYKGQEWELNSKSLILKKIWIEIEDMPNQFQ